MYVADLQSPRNLADPERTGLDNIGSQSRSDPDSKQKLKQGLYQSQ